MNLIQYLSLLLGEECNEVAQRASKLSRFGYDEVQPGQPLSNIERVQEEKTDFMVVYALLLDATGHNDPDAFYIDSKAHRRKLHKLVKFTQLSVEQGMISQAVAKEFYALMPFPVEETAS